jgi:hypothetical protein
MQSLASILKHLLLSVAISAGGLLLFYWMDGNQGNNLNHLFFSLVLVVGILLLSISALTLFVRYLVNGYYKHFLSTFVFIALIVWESTIIVGIGFKNFFATIFPLCGIVSIIVMAIVIILHTYRTKLNSRAG